MRNSCLLVVVAWLGIATATTASSQEILEKGSKPGNVRVVMVNVPVSRAAEELARVAGIAIEGHELLGSTPVTLNFTDAPADAIVPILADVAGFEARRRADGSWRVARHPNHDAIAQARDEAKRARDAKDEAALEKSLQRLLELSPARNPGGLDSLPGPEVDELTWLLERRKDFAAAEAVQRRWLALAERNDLKAESAEALLKIARYSGARIGVAAARSLYERALGLAGAEGVPPSIGTRARIGLAALAMKEGEIDAAESMQARAMCELDGSDPDDFIAIYQLHATSGKILLHALETKDHARAERMFRQRLALYSRFKESFSPNQHLFDLSGLGHNRRDSGKLDSAREAFAEAVALAEQAGLTGRAEYPEALHQRAVIDVVLGRYAEAREGWGRFCGLLHSIRGRDHPGTLAALRDLAALEELAATPAAPPRPASCPIADPAPRVDSPRYASMLDRTLFDEADYALSTRIDVAKAAVPPDSKEVAAMVQRRADVWRVLGKRSPARIPL